jgi:hypothetical protein
MARFVFNMRVSILLFAGSLDRCASTNKCRPKEAVDSTAPTSRAKTCGESLGRRAISTEEFNKKCIALAGPLAAMRGETLVIRMDDGSRKKFDNNNSLGATVAGFGYGLADFYPSTHIFVVGDFGADSTDFTVIDGKTGRELKLGYAFPQLSPDGNWILTIAYSVDEETDSDFAILDVRSKNPLTVWTSKTSKTPLPAKTDFVMWVDDKTIRLASPSQKVMFLLKADDGTWRLSH